MKKICITWALVFAFIGVLSLGCGLFTQLMDNRVADRIACNQACAELEDRIDIADCIDMCKDITEVVRDNLD